MDLNPTQVADRTSQIEHPVASNEFIHKLLTIYIVCWTNSHPYVFSHHLHTCDLLAHIHCFPQKLTIMISSIEEAFRLILSVVYVCPVCNETFEAHEDELAHYRAKHAHGLYGTK